ncbi:predicted protein [Aspergillus terreus NIH2624]|uniref:FAD-binding PCMH-type domain-containing protein n=1 Tax=Aspergillus terreus (strain NIH 2624 / FGSC A1156) TaxID=341663 RepID=Q0CG02_ASPTN|nr:uncharacterized protein ATEG_07390 [Aspergillus terreus NIH2624]EAU32774.1 predicted protein [Aspergillus terreus NIH2624]
MASTNEVESELIALQQLLRPHEIITPNTPTYQPSIQTWACQKQQYPQIVVRPTSIESLSQVISHLYPTDLQFAIYGHGFSSTSAKDVLINMTAFDEFHFDSDSETVTIGAGQTWAEVYRKLGEAAPGYGIVGARTPCVGVAGTAMTGGFSWLSSEYGCISDPANMLDAQVVKYDGSVVWASTEPELLWALRGGGDNKAVVQLVLRVFQYPQNIWAGPILIPREHLQQVAKGIAQFVSKPVDPKITMFLYVVKKRLLEFIGTKLDMLVIHAFDAHGEAHGRATFQWALDFPGAVDQTKVMTLAGVADLQNELRYAKGTMKQFWAPMLLHKISEDTIMRTLKWYEDIEALNSSFADCTYVIFQLLSTRDPAGSRSECAWPRPAGTKHLLLLGIGCPSYAGPEDENLARELAIQAPERILAGKEEVHHVPSGFEDFHDPEKVYFP